MEKPDEDPEGDGEIKEEGEEEEKDVKQVRPLKLTGQAVPLDPTRTSGSAQPDTYRRVRPAKWFHSWFVVISRWTNRLVFLMLCFVPTGLLLSQLRF